MLPAVLGVIGAVVGLGLAGVLGWSLLTGGLPGRGTGGTAAAPSVTASPTPTARVVSFRAPSHNIACRVTASGARCDIRDHDFAAPDRPDTCTDDWGAALAVGAGRAGFVCGGAPASGGRVVAYGGSVRVGDFRCHVSTKGVTCRSLATDHGFQVAREGYTLR